MSQTLSADEIAARAAPLKRKRRLSPLHLLVHLGAWVPLARLAYDAWAGMLSANPIQEITQRLGLAAITLLVLSLACTPANTLFGFRQALKLRRPLGLYAFFYAFLHFLSFAWLDYGFDLSLLPNAIIEKRYVLVGLAALLILAAMAFTSFDYWKARLGKNWKRLHRLVYLAGGLAVLHFAWALKGDIFQLRGDVIRPLLYGLALALLLALRLPPVRRWAAGLRRRLPSRGRG